MAARKPVRTFRQIMLGHRGRKRVLSAGVAELVDALDLGSSDESCGGSSPSARTILRAFPSQSLPRTSREVERARHSRFFSSAGGRAGAAAGLSGILGAAGLISFARGAS